MSDPKSITNIPFQNRQRRLEMMEARQAELRKASDRRAKFILAGVAVLFILVSVILGLVAYWLFTVVA